MISRISTSLLLFSFCATISSAKSLATRDAYASIIQASEVGTIPFAEGFGTNLPAFFPRDTLLHSIADSSTQNLITLLGVKPWPHHADTFLASACFAPNARAIADEPPSKPYCTSLESPPAIQLSLYTYNRVAKKTLRKTSFGPATLKFSWIASNLPSPNDLIEHRSDSIAPQTDYSLDVAPFQIGLGHSAFGIRTLWQNATAGGGTEFIGLALFTPIGNALVPIFSEPLYVHQMIAGGYTPDGSREPDTNVFENNLLIMPDQTDGYFDLLMESNRKDWKCLFRWNSQKMHYQPVDSTSCGTYKEE